MRFTVRGAAVAVAVSRRGIRRVSHDIKIRNSLAGGDRTLALADSQGRPKSLSWYACGPTVYDDSHIGHARTYINTDIIRRILSDYFKIRVNFAMGMTDIDDKIINKAKEDQADDICHESNSPLLPKWLRLARKYEVSFLADMDALHVRRPGAILRVTEHMEEIQAYIATILASGKAYDTPSGVYFSVSQHSKADGGYGKLGNIPQSGTIAAATQSEEQEQGNINGDDDAFATGDKQDPRDFALWKRVTADRASAGEPFWDSPWGPGRPGWHIECSAVTHSHFGPTLDMHSGGIDLRFPHHTNEIAQCEAHNCCDHWVNYWIHTGHLYIDGLKMSKSLKNFISIENYLSGEWRNPRDSSVPHESSVDQRREAADDLRLFFLQHKYHSSLHFSTDRIDEAKQWRRKVSNALLLIRDVVIDEERKSTSLSSTRLKRLNASGISLAEQLEKCQIEVDAALRDDFDTPTALQHLAGLCSSANVYVTEVLNDATVSVDPLRAVHHFVVDTLRIFGLSFPTSLSIICDAQGDVADESNSISNALVDELVSLRFKTRQACVQQLSDIKAFKKEMKKSEIEVDTRTAELYDIAISKCSQSSSNMLAVCDDSRDVLKEKYNVQIRDTKDRSFWKKLN